MDVETGAEKSGHSPNDYRIAEWQSKSYPGLLDFQTHVLRKFPWMPSFFTWLYFSFIYLV